MAVRYKGTCDNASGDKRVHKIRTWYDLPLPSYSTLYCKYAVAPTPCGTGGTCPHFYGRGGTVCRRTANKKLTKLYWPSRKRSLKLLVVLLEPKSGEARPTFFPAIDAPTFAPDRCSPLSNSFRCHFKHVTLFTDGHRHTRTKNVRLKMNFLAAALKQIKSCRDRMHFTVLKYLAY